MRTFVSNILYLNGSFPEYEKLIPSEYNCLSHFDTSEVLKSVNSLKALSDGKSYPINLTVADGKIVMANPDDKGQAEIVAETQGEVKIRLDGNYLADTLRACGGMVEVKLTDGKSPVLFTTNGYKLVVMPMITAEAKESESKSQEQSPDKVKTETEGKQQRLASPVSQEKQNAADRKSQ